MPFFQKLYFTFTPNKNKYLSVDNGLNDNINILKDQFGNLQMNSCTFLRISKHFLTDFTQIIFFKIKFETWEGPFYIIFKFIWIANFLHIKNKQYIYFNFCTPSNNIQKKQTTSLFKHCSYYKPQIKSPGHKYSILSLTLLSNQIYSSCSLSCIN